MILTWWEIVIIPILTLLLNLATVPVHLYFDRKRQKASNGLRVVSEIFSMYEGKNTCWDSDREKMLWDKVHAWKETPNSLGSEAHLAILIGEFCAAYKVSFKECKELDRALNSLDQRASERERSHNKSIQSR